MNISEAKKACHIILKAGHVPMLWGPPGIGKTSMVKDLAKEYNVEYKCLTNPALLLNLFLYFSSERRF